MRRGEDRAEDRKKSGVARLLDTGFQEVGGLQQDGGAEAGEETGEKMEGRVGLFMAARWCYVLRWRWG